MTTTITPDAQPIFVARQPVFDAKGQVWGFELLYRHSDQITRAEIKDPDAATMSIIADGFSLASAKDHKSMILVNFPAALLLSEAAFALPPERCIIEVLEDVEPTQEVLDAVGRIKEAGYRVALDDYIGREDYRPLLELADIVKVDILEMDHADLTRVTEGLRPYKATLLAEKVEHKVEFSLARKLGYSYFQGHYFERAEIVSGRKISVQLMPRLQLIQTLAAEDFDMDKVVSILSMDTGLTYRLLQFINSAFFALPNPIKTVRQAVTMLGARQLRQWLLAVAVADFNATGAQRVSAEAGLHRARFLQLLSACCKIDPDNLFLLGLFSKLDVLFGLPMEELMDQLPLDEAMKAALVKGEGELGQWLDLTRKVEHGEWEEARDILAAKGISVENAAKAHSSASTWTGETLDSVG